MTFSVEPDALTLLAGELRSLDTTTGFGDLCIPKDAYHYSLQHVKLEGIADIGLLLGIVATQTNALREALTRALDHTSDALSGGANELVGAAHRYNELDEQARRELDAAYPDAGRSSSDYILAVGCPASPLGSLIDPPAVVPVEWYGKILTNDWLSPSSTVAMLIDLAFNWNPFSEVAKVFVGDWDQLEKVGSACRVLGDYLQQLTRAAEMSAGNCMREWSGEAADAASAWFTDFSTFGEDSFKNLDELCQHYIGMCQTVSYLGGKLSGLMAQIMDAMLYAALLAAAAVVTSETVVGAIVFGALTWLEVSKAANLIVMAYQTLMEAHDYVEMITALVGAGAAALTTSSYAVVVPGAYDYVDSAP